MLHFLGQTWKAEEPTLSGTACTDEEDTSVEAFRAAELRKDIGILEEFVRVLLRRLLLLFFELQGEVMVTSPSNTTCTPSSPLQKCTDALNWCCWCLRNLRWGDIISSFLNATLILIGAKLICSFQSSIHSFSWHHWTAKTDLLNYRDTYVR